MKETVYIVKIQTDDGTTMKPSDIRDIIWGDGLTNVVEVSVEEHCTCVHTPYCDCNKETT